MCSMDLNNIEPCFTGTYSGIAKCGNNFADFSDRERFRYTGLRRKWNG